MTTTLEKPAWCMNFKSCRTLYDRLSVFKARGCFSTRSRVIVFTDSQTNKQTARFTFRRSTGFASEASYSPARIFLLFVWMRVCLYVCVHSLVRMITFERFDRSSFSLVCDEFLSKARRRLTFRCKAQLLRVVFTHSKGWYQTKFTFLT